MRDRYIDGLYAEHSVFGQKQYTIKDYYAFGRIIAQRKTTTGTNPTSSVTYLLADHLGSTVGTVSEAGVTEHMQYNPFGSVRSGHVSTDRGFTGQRREGGSRLGAYFYNARFYATGLGHFLSADTVSTDGLDRYAYVRFNPLRYNDPSGHVIPSDGGGSCDTICQWQAAWAAFHPEQAASGGSGGCDDLCRCASDAAACSALAGEPVATGTPTPGSSDAAPLTSVCNDCGSAPRESHGGGGVDLGDVAGAVVNVHRFVRNAPETALAVTWALRHGGSCQIDGNLFIACTGMSDGFGSRGGMTVGNVFLTGDSRQDLAQNPALVRHENRHATQWATLGPLRFLIAYGISEVVGRGPCGNVFEQDAGLAAGGYQC